MSIPSRKNVQYRECPMCGFLMDEAQNECPRCQRIKRNVVRLPITKSVPAWLYYCNSVMAILKQVIPPVLLVLAVVGVIILFNLNNIRYYYAQRSFRDTIQGYVNIPDLSEDKSITPYLVGKVIVVDLLLKQAVNENDNARNDELLYKVLRHEEWNQLNKYVFLSLPANIRAKSPDEVDTIIWLKWGREPTGHKYTDDIDAAYVTCQVVVIDRVKSLIVGTARFTGGNPKSFINPSRTSDSHFGSPPTKDISKFIQSLTVR